MSYRDESDIPDDGIIDTVDSWCEQCGGSGLSFEMDDIPVECKLCGGTGVNESL